MTIQQQIKTDLTGAMKAKDEEKKSTLRVIMGEFARSDAKELSALLVELEQPIKLPPGLPLGVDGKVTSRLDGDPQRRN